MTRHLVITATPTLFDTDHELDPGANREHLRWLERSGVDAIFAAGTTGEFHTLGDDERLRVLDLGLEVFGPERTYFHVGAASTRHAVALTSEAVSRGARHLAAVTPYYLPAPEEQVVDYYARLVEAAGDAQVYAYLFQARTSTPSRPELLARLAANGVAGVKISGETDESVAGFLAGRPEGFVVYSGNDVSFGWLGTAGGDGIVSGVSSVFPEPFVALRDALRADDTDAAQRWQDEVARAVMTVGAGSLTHLKAGVTARGFRGGPVRSAVAPVSDPDRKAIVALADHFAAVTAS